MQLRKVGERELKPVDHTIRQTTWNPHPTKRPAHSTLWSGATPSQCNWARVRFSPIWGCIFGPDPGRPNMQPVDSMTRRISWNCFTSRVVRPTRCALKTIPCRRKKDMQDYVECCLVLSLSLYIYIYVSSSTHVCAHIHAYVCNIYIYIYIYILFGSVFVYEWRCKMSDVISIICT